VGRRHLVGDPDAVAGRRVLRADGGVGKSPPSSLRGATRRSNPDFLFGLLDCFASLAMTHEKEKRAERPRVLCQS